MSQYAPDLCKVGQGEKCCRYIVMGSKGFECMKIDPDMKKVLDARVNSMGAKGDNCEGKDLNL